MRDHEGSTRASRRCARSARSSAGTVASWSSARTRATSSGRAEEETQWHVLPASTSPARSGWRSRSPTSSESACRPRRRSAPTLELDPNTKVSHLTEDEVNQIRTYIDQNLKIEGDLRRDVQERHQAQDRDRLPPGHPSPQGSAGPWPAHPHQRPHPQGPEAHGCQQEEGSEEVMAKPKPGGVVRASATARTSAPVWCTSRARSTTRSSRSPTPRATSSPGRRPAPSASRAAARARRSPPSSPPRRPAAPPWSMVCNAPKFRSRARVRAATPPFARSSTTGIEVTSIKDVTPVPHNGCRQPKRRRG